MSKFPLRTISNDLPKANIYLDDLFEIEQIISEALNENGDTTPFRFEYEVEERIRLTTHEDLIEHGGHASKFSLRFVSENSILSSTVLFFHGRHGSLLQIPYALKSHEWEIFVKVEQIFKGRRRSIKNFARSIPFWMFFCVAFAAICWPLLGLNSLSEQISKFRIAIGVLNTLFLVVWCLVSFSSDKIYFMHSRDDEKGKAANRRDFTSKLLIALVSAIITATVTLIVTSLTGHLKH